jgi:stearoyl-CoA desaturase (delta-9 desaturase)
MFWIVYSLTTPSMPSRLRRTFSTLIQWFDADFQPSGAESVRNEPDRVDWVRCIPFMVLHLGCLGVIWTGASAFAVWTAVALYFFRMATVTGVYHRYFSHKTYSTARPMQFILALCGGTTVQRGPLWWAYHHRHHHQHSDQPEDAHSPHVHGFLWSHIGWITSRRNFPTDYSKVRDLDRYPELVFLNRFDAVVPIAFALAIFGLGSFLGTHAPGLHTNGWQLLVWGFFISTTALFHGTSCINSMAHLMGRRRYKTEDDSRNSFILAIVTLGEGWHNNHHRYQSSTRNGFFWWELDITYYLLRCLSWTGLIWGLKSVPASVLAEGERSDHHDSVAAASRAQHVHPEYASLKRIVPAAAAIAVATVNATQPIVTRRADAHPMHRDAGSLAQGATEDAGP